MSDFKETLDICKKNIERGKFEDAEYLKEEMEAKVIYTLCYWLRDTLFQTENIDAGDIRIQYDNATNIVHASILLEGIELYAIVNYSPATFDIHGFRFGYIAPCTHEGCTNKARIQDCYSLRSIARTIDTVTCYKHAKK